MDETDKPRHYILGPNRELIPCDLMAWARWLESTHGKRHVQRTVLRRKVVVSTVFLGLDHSWGEGPPLLFETMIFGGPMSDYQARYSTWDEAENGHAEAVVLAKAADSWKAWVKYWWSKYGDPYWWASEFGTKKWKVTFRLRRYGRLIKSAWNRALHP